MRAAPGWLGLCLGGAVHGPSAEQQRAPRSPHRPTGAGGAGDERPKVRLVRWACGAAKGWSGVTQRCDGLEEEEERRAGVFVVRWIYKPLSAPLGSASFQGLDLAILVPFWMVSSLKVER